jgi:hypothetical protein
MADAKIAGIPMLRAAAATLELALRLQPQTRYVAVVAGSTPGDLASAEQFRRETSTFANRVGFTWLVNLSLPELRAELSRLPDHTVVLYLTMFQDPPAFPSPRDKHWPCSPVSDTRECASKSSHAERDCDDMMRWDRDTFGVKQTLRCLEILSKLQRTIFTDSTVGFCYQMVIRNLCKFL